MKPDTPPGRALVLSEAGVPVEIPDASLGAVLSDIHDVLEDRPLTLDTVRAGRQLAGTDDEDGLRIELTIVEDVDEVELL